MRETATPLVALSGNAQVSPADGAAALAVSVYVPLVPVAL